MTEQELKEIWFFENPVAQELVEIGLQQAKTYQFSNSPPDINADTMLADHMTV